LFAKAKTLGEPILDIGFISINSRLAIFWRPLKVSKAFVLTTPMTAFAAVAASQPIALVENSVTLPSPKNGLLTSNGLLVKFVMPCSGGSKE
jgi:hypothetical protein